MMINELTDQELIDKIKEARPMTQEVCIEMKPYISELQSRGSMYKLDKKFIKQRTWKK